MPEPALECRSGSSQIRLARVAHLGTALGIVSGIKETRGELKPRERTSKTREEGGR